jgi:hypothetical protein
LYDRKLKKNMKKFLFISLIFALLPFFTFAQKAKETKKRAEVGCNANEHLNKCVESLRPQGYRFLKSYKLEGNASKPLEYQYTLSKGTTYFISLQHNPDVKLKVILYNQDGREEASNYNKKLDKYYPSVEIRCQRTGVYKITFSQESKKDFCAASVLGFKR